MKRTTYGPALLIAIMVALVATPTGARAGAGDPRWITRIDNLVAGHQVSVSIGLDGTSLYTHRPNIARTPASNQKLVLSMALFDRLGHGTLVSTWAKATAEPVDGIVHGDLWIIGRGDPEIGRAQMSELADAIVAAGVTRVRGHVYGSTGYFARDWWAPGWRTYFPELEIALPTALTYELNEGPSGGHIEDPERRAAASLAGQLESRGVPVGRPGMGRSPSGLAPIASITSDPLREIVRRMNLDSINFYAEVLGKLLGATEVRTPGTIAKCAAALEAFASDNGATVEASDCSGLSYYDRVAPADMVQLLWAADASAWGARLRAALPRGGQGTLRDRLKDVKVRAKTGTLTEISALSGWVWLEGPGVWAEFSIMSQGMSKATAVRIEDAIVRTVAAHAA